jgi:hypothetical protein
VYLVAWPTFHRAGAPWHRHAYNAASVTVACLAASAVLHAVPGLLAWPAAIGTFMGINLALAFAAIVTARHWDSLPYLAKPRTHVIVLSTQIVGAVLGAAMIEQEFIGVAALPLLFALHTRIARDTVRDAGACIDSIWTYEAWVVLAEEAHRLGEWFSVLVVDFDRSGDAVAVAEGLLARLRRGNSIGRLAPYQFVILLAECPAAAAAVEARFVADELGEAGLPVGVGSADSLCGTVQDMLALAAGDAVVQRLSAYVAAESRQPHRRP